MANKLKVIAATFVAAISFFVFLLATAGTGCSVPGRSSLSDSGYVSIFDGKTMEGWKGDPQYWKVENGNLVGEITPTTLLKSNSFIIWQGGELSDFELKLEFRITRDGNSGVNYRSSQLTEPAYALRGYQADIDGQHRYTGQNYEERGRTTLAYRGEIVRVKPFPGENGSSISNYTKNNAWTERVVTGSLGTIDALKTEINSGDWNSCRLVIKGNRLQHYINDVLMSDVTDEDEVNGKKSGLLGVQVHVGPPMKVEYRNIMLKK